MVFVKSVLVSDDREEEIYIVGDYFDGTDYLGNFILAFEFSKLPDGAVYSKVYMKI